MGLCARSRGSAFVRVHGGCVWFHSSRTSDTWPRHTRFVRLSLSPSSTSFFHPLIGTLNPNNGAEKTEKASPSPCARHVAADKLITIRTIDRPLSLDPRRQQIREREERLPLPPIVQSNYHIEPTRLSPISFPLSPSFLCFPVSHHGQLIGVIYKGKPENLGIRNPPGSNKSQVGERDGNGTPLVSWLYCSYYRAMHH